MAGVRDILLLGAICALLVTLARFFRRRRRDLAFAKTHGCEPAQKMFKNLPFGIDHLQRILTADRDKRFPTALVERQTKYGLNRTIEYNCLGALVFYTVDPVNIQAILATQFQDFILGHLRSGNFSQLLGNGIFTQDGDAWKHSRALLRPHFARAQIDDLEWLEPHTANLLDEIRDVNGGGLHRTPVDLQPLFFRLTFNAALEFLFGDISRQDAPNALGISDNQRAEFATAFDRSQSYMATRLRLGPAYWIYNPGSFQISCQQVQTFVERIVENALASEKELPPAPESRHTFLAALMQDTRDPVEIRQQLLHILLAGRDTTASLLSWLFLTLSRDKARYAELRSSIITTFGADGHGAPLTMHKIKSCLPLMYALQETLRLYPPVPVNARYAVCDTTLPTGGGPTGTSPVFIPAGTEVSYSVHAMHRLRNIWGDDAEEWKPERWNGRKAGWEYLPFNGGPRICLGQQFALMQAAYVTVRVLQRFESMEGIGHGELRFDLGLTARPADGVKCVLHECRAL